MDKNHAVSLLDDMCITLPGWDVSVKHYDNFSHGIQIDIDLTTPDTDPSTGGTCRTDTRSYVFDCSTCKDAKDLAYHVVQAVCDVFQHEVREGLFVNGLAIFHPHRSDGILAFSAQSGRDPMRDLLFGVA